MDLKSRILEFLYNQVQEGKIPQIRKGMVEDFESFITKELAQQQAAKMAARMASEAKKEEDKNV